MGRFFKTVLLLGLVACTASDSPVLTIRFQVPREAYTRERGGPPSSLAGMQCYVVNIVGPQVKATLASDSYGPNHCVEPGALSRLTFPTGSTMQATVRLGIGTSRRIQVWGVVTSSQNGCEGATTLADLLRSDNNRPSLYLVGEKAVHSLSGGEIQVPLSYSAATTRDLLRCSGLDLSLSPVSRNISRNKSLQLFAQGGTPPYQYSIFSGDGSVTETGKYTAGTSTSTSTGLVKVKVTDSAGHTAGSDITTQASGTVIFNKTLNVVSGVQSFNGVVFQSDGKVVAAGSTSGSASPIVLARYLSDGNLDPSFSDDGVVKTTLNTTASLTATAIAIQRVNGQERILVTGQYKLGTVTDIYVARFKPDGTLDTSSFGTGNSGYVTVDVNAADAGTAIAVRPDGKIVVAGNANSGSEIWVTLFTSNGSLDTTFNSPDGKFKVETNTGPHAALAIQSDNKILVGASLLPVNAEVSRIKADGSGLDTTFNLTGQKLVTPPAATDTTLRALSVQVVNGSEYVLGAGYFAKGAASTRDWFWFRLTDAGANDTGFNATGMRIKDLGASDEDQLNAVALEEDGSFLSAGFRTSTGNTDFAVSRNLRDSPLDNGFGSSGLLFFTSGASSNNALGLALLPTGEVALVGKAGTNFAVAQFWQ